MADPFAVLGVGLDCTDAEVRQAYRALALRFHPDKNPAGAERFKDIGVAYEALSDPVQRQRLRSPTHAATHGGHAAGTDRHRGSTNALHEWMFQMQQTIRRGQQQQQVRPCPRPENVAARLWDEQTRMRDILTDSERAIRNTLVDWERRQRPTEPNRDLVPPRQRPGARYDVSDSMLRHMPAGVDVVELYHCVEFRISGPNFRIMGRTLRITGHAFGISVMSHLLCISTSQADGIQ